MGFLIKNGIEIADTAINANININIIRLFNTPHQEESSSLLKISIILGRTVLSLGQRAFLENSTICFIAEAGGHRVLGENSSI
jgi:hypothetical protein